MARLIIGATERERVAEMIAYAKATPVTFDDIRTAIVPHQTSIKLEDRQPGFKRPPSQRMIFRGGFRAAYSIEVQPVGLCAHLSISVVGRSQKGMMPSPQAVVMIAQEFGIPFPAHKMWQEEFDPGEWAINLLQLYAPTPEGHA